MIEYETLKNMETSIKRFASELEAIAYVVYLHTGLKMEEHEAYRDYVSRALSKGANTYTLKSIMLH